MLVEGEAVGHAGDVVGDRLGGPGGIALAGARLPLRRQTVGLVVQALEQLRTTRRALRAMRLTL